VAFFGVTGNPFADWQVKSSHFQLKTGIFLDSRDPHPLQESGELMNRFM